MAPKFTDRQRIFCENLNRGMSATEAARKAGYSEEYANRQAGKLVDKSPAVQAYLAELREASKSTSIADGKERREFLTRVLRREEKDVAVGGSEFGPLHIETPAPLTERLKAAELLAKMDGDLAPVKVDVKVTEYSKSWAKQFLKLVGEYVSPEQLREIASRAPRFEP